MDSRKMKEAFLEVKGILLHYYQEVGSIVTSIFSHEAHNINVCEKTVHC